MELIRLDGSHGEGGGQVLRSALALSAATGRPVEIYNIRARRSRPGLAPQHLTAVRAVGKLCGAAIDGDSVGSVRVKFVPFSIKPGDYSFDIGTAGSATLVLQALLPVALAACGDVRLEVTGGTDVPMSPPVFYFRDVFLPAIRKMGAEASFEILRRGFYPKGGGRVALSVAPWAKRVALVLAERGELREIRIDSVATEHLRKARVAERQAESAIKALGIDSATISAEYADSYSPGSSLSLTADYENCRLGAGSLGERGVPAETVGKTAADALADEIASCATADLHASDQLLLYMALASGGEFTAGSLTEHAETSIWLIEHFIDKKFSVERCVNCVKIRL
jgi:RNA 3'-phosphate cyclase